MATVSSSSVIREDHHSRFNCAGVTILGLLVIQAVIVYLTYFSPTYRSPAAVYPPQYTSNNKEHSVATHRKEANRRLRLDGIHNGLGTLSNSILTQHSTVLSNRTEQNTRQTTINPDYFLSGPTWKKGSFCDSFVEHTFETPLPVCGDKLLPEHSIKCFHNDKSRHMVYCILESVFMSGPRKLRARADLGLLVGGERLCPHASLSGLHKTTEQGDPNRTLLDKIVAKHPESVSVCQEWINKTAFLYTGDQSVHIYFRMNAYYNLHKAISREGVAPGEFVIIRHASDSRYLFPEWERSKLFPELIHINDLPNKTVCFRKLVLVPSAYFGILFRCKMESNVVNSCFNCKGRGLYGSSLYSFRRRVITSCGLTDEEERVGNRITIVSRTPYKRWTKDELAKFQRVLSNEDELVKALKKEYPHTNITVAHMETLDICTQVYLAHDADVVMGVHGAGLVHLWWLREDGLALELNPTYQESNPTFKMLSTLSGRNYVSVTVTGSKREVSVKVDDVIRMLKSHTHIS